MKVHVSKCLLLYTLLFDTAFNIIKVHGTDLGALQDFLPNSYKIIVLTKSTNTIFLSTSCDSLSR